MVVIFKLDSQLPRITEYTIVLLKKYRRVCNVVIVSISSHLYSRHVAIFIE